MKWQMLAIWFTVMIFNLAALSGIGFLIYLLYCYLTKQGLI